MSRLDRIIGVVVAAAALALVALPLWLGRPPLAQPWTVRQLLDQAPAAGTEVEIIAPVVVEGGSALACSALTESWPPGCGEPSVRVTGLPSLGMQAAGDVSWLDSTVLRVEVVSAEEVAFLEVRPAAELVAPAGS